MSLPIDPTHLPEIVARLQADGACYYNVGVGKSCGATRSDWTPWTEGRVSVNVVVPELLPVRNSHPYGAFTAADGYCIRLVAKRVQVWQFDGVTDGSDVTVVGADPTPGDHIAVIRKVPS